jgi:hypothetical protein
MVGVGDTGSQEEMMARVGNVRNFHGNRCSYEKLELGMMTGVEVTGWLESKFIGGGKTRELRARKSFMWTLNPHKNDAGE